MGVSVFAASPDLPKPGDAPKVHEAGLTREQARALVEAIAALPDADDVSWPVFRDDNQFGWYASRVHPDRLAALVAEAGDAALAGAVAPLMARAVRERRFVDVGDGTEFPGRPMLTLHSEHVGEESAEWVSPNAVSAFAAVGLDLDTSVGIQVRADELAARCRASGSADRRVARLAAIAAYALGREGPDALVCAA